MFIPGFIKEGVSQGIKSWAVLNIMPFLKGFEDSFVKRPQWEKYQKCDVLSGKKIKNWKIPPLKPLKKLLLLCFLP